MAEQVSARTMHPHLGRFLIRRIRDQIEGVPRLDVLQVLIPVREGDPMNRGSEMRWPTIRERRSQTAHSGLIG
jgi:hypothetical protein